MVNYPNDWNNDIIDNIADVNTGIRDTQDRVKNGRYPFFIRSSEVQKLDEFDYDCEAVLTVGDGQIGKIFHYVNGKFSAHQRVYVISNFKKITGKYFFYNFSRFFYNEVMAQTAKTTVDSVRKPMITEMTLRYPADIKEQKIIVKALDSFDKHIENLEELIAKKKMIRDGAVEDLVSGKKRLQGFNTEWENTPLIKIAEILNGLTYQPENVRTYGKLVLRSSNIQDDRLVFRDNVYVDENIVNTKNVEIGDIVICVRNGSAALIGKSARINEEINATIGAFMTNIRCFNTKTSGFLYYFTKSEVFKKFVNEVLGATINQITKADFKRLKIMLPSDVKEQKLIANILSSMDKEIENLEKEKEKYIQLKSGAMDDLLTGKIRLV